MSSFIDSFGRNFSDSQFTDLIRPSEDNDHTPKYDPLFPSQRFDSSSNFYNDFGESADPVLPLPTDTEGFAVREWRRLNEIRLVEKEKKEKELLSGIIDEADHYKIEFQRIRVVNVETNKVTNREKERLFTANQEKFHAEADKDYWKAIAEAIPNELQKKTGKKDQEKTPVVMIQGPKPGKPTDLSRMHQLLTKLKHETPPHLKPSFQSVPAPTNDAKASSSASPAPKSVHVA